MTAAQAVGVVLIVFAIAKLAIALRALARRRAHLAGTPGAVDPAAGLARPWLFRVWVGWRLATAALALPAGVWLLGR